MIANILASALIGLVALLLAWVLTPLAREGMRRLGAVDLPDPRRVNRVPVPRGGGLAVVAAFCGAIGVAWGFYPEAFIKQISLATVFPWYVAASGLLVAVGFLDDRWGVPALPKLGAQLVAAGLMCWGGARFLLPVAWGAWAASPWIYVPLTLGWYIGVINAFNLIDGLDGLSSGLAIIATLGMLGVSLVLNPGLVPIASMAFIGALLGFLRYNYNPASVFLGDSGSLFVGLTVGTFALIARRSDTFLATMGFAVLCMGVPLIDTTLAILRRTLRYLIAKENPGERASEATAVMTADREHVHHRFLSWAKGNQRRAVWGLYALAAALVLLGILTMLLRAGNATVFLLGFLVFAFIIVRTMTNVEFWDAGHILAKPGSRNARRAIAVPIYIFADVFSMAALLYLLRWVLGPMLPALHTTAWLNLLIAYSVPVIVALALVRAYDRIWGRSTRKDSFLLLAAILLGSAASHIVILVVAPGLPRALGIFHGLWAFLLAHCVIFSRLGKTVFLQYLAAAENRRLKQASAEDPTIERVLFYGAGVTLRAYITLYEINVTRNHVAMVGVLDVNPGLRGRIFRDLPILGPLEALEDPDRLARLRPTRIILTTPAIGPKRLAEIQAFCARHGIAVSRCAIEEHEVLPHAAPR